MCTIILIQGVFFQRMANFNEIGALCEIPSEENSLVQTRWLPFYGMIHYAEEKWIGEIIDYYGRSSLSDIHIGNHEFEFKKQYEEKPDVIQYEFAKNNGVWIGTWKFDSNDSTGTAKCVTNEVHRNFFLPANTVHPLFETTQSLEEPQA